MNFKASTLDAIMLLYYTGQENLGNIFENP